MSKDRSKKRLKQRNEASSVKKYWVRLTRLCNNRCIFCLDKEPQNGTVIPLSEIKKRFKEGLKEGSAQVILSGGEATLHPKFLEIVKMAKKMGYKKTQVITNGRMFAYKDFLNEAVKAGVDEITFSIHGHNAALNDALTGIKGSFDQSFRGLKNALAIPGLIVNQDIVINKMNAGQLREVLDFFIYHGIREFDLLQIIPFGRAWDNRKKLFYDTKKELPKLRKAFELSKREDIFIWTNRFPAKYLAGYEELIQNPKKIYDEVRGRRELFNDLLKKGKMMECYPERCRFCFLSEFCRDLREFKKKGILRNKPLSSCLSKKESPVHCLIFDKKTNIDDFADFFINYRYFIKGPNCSVCKNNKKCQGADVNLIRSRGFKILSPLPKKFHENTFDKKN